MPLKECDDARIDDQDSPPAGARKHLDDAEHMHLDDRELADAQDLFE